MKLSMRRIILDFLGQGPATLDQIESRAKEGGHVSTGLRHSLRAVLSHMKRGRLVKKSRGVFSLKVRAPKCCATPARCETSVPGPIRPHTERLMSQQEPTDLPTLANRIKEVRESLCTLVATYRVQRLKEIEQLDRIALCDEKANPSRRKHQTITTAQGPPLTRTILDLFATTPSLRYGDIIKAVMAKRPGTPRGSVGATLCGLVNSGRLRRAAVGEYTLPTPAPAMGL